MVLPNTRRPERGINGLRMPRVGLNVRTLIRVSGMMILLFLVLTWGPTHQPIQELLPKAKELKPWEKGMLEIHHLRVGPSESSFIIFPDGTTMMVDAGDINLAVKLPELWKRGHKGLQIRPPFPSADKSTSEWAVDYIHQFWPRPNEPIPNRKLDFFLLTHFHTDHMGDDPHPSMPWNDPIKQQYRLSGITEVANLLPIYKIVDRGYPGYNYPPFLQNWTKIAYYTTFLEKDHKRQGGLIEKFVVGSNSQFRLERDSSLAKEFRVLNIKGNLEVYFESNGTIAKIPGEIFSNAERTKWDENEMSSAIRIDYGAFRYYEGGDVEAHANPFGSIDTITPTAVAAGKVDVATANHHGRGTNQAFCTELDPAVVIMQGLFSDQPLVETMEFLTQPRPVPNDKLKVEKNEKRLLLVTDIFPERLRAIGPENANALDAINGHVVVRVSKPGPEQRYNVYMLNANRDVKAHFGPFVPRRLT